MTYSVACRSGHPVKAICLSGGYKDTDEGHWMLYSGQGGRDGKGHWVSPCLLACVCISSFPCCTPCPTHPPPSPVFSPPPLSLSLSLSTPHSLSAPHRLSSAGSRVMCRIECLWGLLSHA